MSISVAAVTEAFEKRFGAKPELVVRAPGRVNIIGEHTDYNHGFVLPMAIERETAIAGRRRDDGVLCARAENLDREVTVRLDERVRNAAEPWIDYIMGVVDELYKADKTPVGADIVILGDVPLGCGLSSSAALEMAALCLFEELGGFKFDGPEAARLGQRVENNFLGLKSGIMDQFISRCGKADHGLFLDCRSFAYDLVPISFNNALFVIANTKCARGLTASKYNERVGECGEAVAALRAGTGREGTHLRDFRLGDLEACRAGMGDIAFRRARHVITEDLRTQQACTAMGNGDKVTLGALMTESDFSLRDDYEVTSPELDAMAEVARSLPGCHGARMTGAGFGGCTINLVDADQSRAFRAALMEGYTKATGIAGELILSRPADGANRIA
jgi:galactokinase